MNWYTEMKKIFTITCLISLLSIPKAYCSRQVYPPTDQYKIQHIEGWKIYVNSELTGRQPDLAEKTLKLLQSHLYRIKRVVPEKSLQELRDIPIWVEYKNRPEKHPCMCYHPSRQWLTQNGFNPEKAGSVELAGAENFLKWTKAQPWMVLHELAHGYHHKVLTHGNKELKELYDKAVKSKSYEKVLHINGSKYKAYALNNDQEYFAETTEAFFGTNDFYPFVRSELKEHDPEMFEFHKKIWK